MSPYLDDPDVTLWNGDALEVLREMESESVDCCVTSPPYWGLRDYGIPGQLGLEPTPEEYVARLVTIFEEVRRVLSKSGTLWLNLGDSYSGSVAAGDKIFGNPVFNKSRPSRASTKTPGRTMPIGLKPKDLIGIPWRVAFALQAAGWYLRSDIIWAKPNPMPESVTDRPTKAHEYVFLLTKSPRYFYDQESLREPHKEPWRSNGKAERNNWSVGGTEESRGSHETTRQYNPAGRNVRSVWEIATEPYPDAHFATFPTELARRCILGGCPEWVCRTCGKAREAILSGGGGEAYDKPVRMDGRPDGAERRKIGGGQKEFDSYVRPSVVGFTDCECLLSEGELERLDLERVRVSGSRTDGVSPSESKHRPGVVLDPFAGSGTVGYVARKLSRRAVLIELSEDYCKLAAKRLSQLSLLA